MPQQHELASALAADERAADGRDVTTILDADATIRYVSPSIERILGYKPEQLVGQNWFQYVHPEDAAHALPGFGQATSQPGIVERNALRVRHANGSWVKVEEVGSNLLHYPGVHGWILSARNAAHGATANGAATPAGKLEESMAIATQRCESLERSNRWHTELVATLSHELRTPLNVILGYHDLLLDGTFGALTPEQSYTLRRAHRSAREMLDIISATLDLSRLDSGRIRLMTQTIATRELFEELGPQIQDLCEKPGVTLVWAVAPDVPKIATDPAKLKMIVKHLVRNAVQLIDSGTATVTVRPQADGIEIAVSTRGPGLWREALTAVFISPREPDASVFERFGGSWLALDTARRLTQLLGGRVTVRSETAGDATVRVVLPIGAAR